LSRTLALVGLGLLGGSIAEAARKRFPGLRILGVSRPGALSEARGLGLIDEAFDYARAGEALGQCDFAFLCTPIDQILQSLEAWSRRPFALRPGAVISDVGSTKAGICALGRQAFPPASGGVFIGSHPMAGSEKTGLQSRDPHLFENAAWILCPDAQTPDKSLRALQDFVGGLGAHALRMDPEEHDAVIAQVSHLPQLLATALAAFVSRAGKAEPGLQIAGGGFRDMTRLAASSFSVWDPIFRTNRQNLQELLPRFRSELESLETALADGGMEKSFAEANALRARFAAPRKGFVAPLTEILVDLEDKPGALLQALTPLAREGVNVLDLEILKVREGEEGVLMMGFRKAGEANAALELLAESGHQARLR
jgi:prephenate dehydrogenase